MNGHFEGLGVDDQELHEVGHFSAGGARTWQSVYTTIRRYHFQLIAGLVEQAGELTILISSHELNEIEGLATDIGFLHAGRLLFQEPMNQLTERCREMYVTLDSTAQVPDPLPAHWLHARAVGNVLMFVETQFSDDMSKALVLTLCDGVREIDAKPMNLRSIFTTLAPAARDGVVS